MFCKYCGQQLPDHSTFCSQCGNAVASGYSYVAAGDPTAPAARESASANGIRPGFSDRIHDPAVTAALKKNNKATAVFGILLVLAPIVITAFLGWKDGDYTVLGYGAAIACIFMIFSFFSLVKKKAEKQWDGVVIDKYTETKQDNSSNPSGDDSLASHTVYVTKIRKESGRIKKLEEREYRRPYYEYLNIGDKVRYHPQFNYYYEKFDKRSDSYLICPICESRNSPEGETCSRCGVPIIK